MNEKLLWKRLYEWAKELQDYGYEMEEERDERSAEEKMLEELYGPQGWSIEQLPVSL